MAATGSMPQDSRSQPLAKSTGLPIELSKPSPTSPSLEIIRAKDVATPPPLSSSMTPPPSSQIPPRPVPMTPPRPSQEDYLTSVRTPTPSMSLLSSPPPTIQASGKDFCLNDNGFRVPTPHEIARASPAELRDVLESSTSELGNLSVQLQEARTAAAHYKLQHNLLQIETTEAFNRMVVENEMTKREVEILQAVDYHETPLGTPVSKTVVDDSRITQDHLSQELKHFYAAVQNENDVLRRRLYRAKKIILDREGTIDTLTEDNYQLRKRIKENRDHLNKLRGPGGLYEFSTPRQSQTLSPATPRRSTPRNPSSAKSIHLQSARSGGDDRLAALLRVTDQVLSQEQHASVSSTPRDKSSKASQLGHTRGTHSLSSLQSTNRESRPNTATSASLLPPVSFSSGPLSQSSQMSPPGPRTQGKHRRRESRDSTISASEREDNGQYDESEDEDVPESQASQLATSMLRRASSSKVESPSSSAAKTSGLLQTKLFGQVKKVVTDRAPTHELSKKRVHNVKDIEERGAKRPKVLEGVGLGIGYP
ncbi:MAG: hypothetical protein M1824_003231 [Vezdaea acicularis]|nr:MAG: hypothetical protein M1824_003231 [Vezdaea acicularis]